MQPISKLELHELSLKNPKGFFIKNKHPNRRQRRLEQRWIAKNARRIEYAKKKKDEKRMQKLDEERKLKTNVFTNQNWWSKLGNWIKKIFK
jgi:hypothetical protein